MKILSLFPKTHLIPFLFFLALGPFFAGSSLAENSASQITDETDANDPRNVFSRLDEYLRNNTISFVTSYDAKNMSLGASRGRAQFYVGRPNLLRIELTGSGFSYLMTSDGKDFTIYDGKTNKYAQRPATERPIDALNIFTGLAALQARVLQFIGLVGNISRGDSDVKVTKAGVDRIGDQTCVRYDIRYESQTDSDIWTAWLRKDGVPLPCKTVIRSPDEGSHQTNLYTWQNENSEPQSYVFAPPKGSKKVDISDLGLRPVQ
ncbi:hypothetical protein DLM45_00830 [Hyphomicrobium methylovorum]|nr:hypothetical protein [Hyphomicrobium methylovorum]